MITQVRTVYRDAKTGRVIFHVDMDLVAPRRDDERAVHNARVPEHGAHPSSLPVMQVRGGLVRRARAHLQRFALPAIGVAIVALLVTTAVLWPVWFVVAVLVTTAF